MRNKVLLPKRLRGIHLGFSTKNSAWLIGTVNSEGRFSTYETRDVSFCEDILVRDVRALDVQSSPDPPLMQTLLDKLLGVEAEKRKSAGTEKSVVGEVPDDQLQGLQAVQWEVPEALQSQELRTSVIGELKTEARGAPRPLNSKISARPEVLDLDTADNGGDDQDKEPEIVPTNTDWRNPLLEGKPACQSVPEAKEAQDQNRQQSASGVQFGPSAEIKRRGRPRGSKDLSKRKRRTRKEMNKNKNADLDAAQAFFAEEEEIDDFYSHLAMDADEEEIEEVEIFLAKGGEESQPGDSVKASWAFSKNNPERPKWVEAKEKEEARLNAYETWRKLTEEEELDWKAGKIKAVPTALILNRKRCGRYKARLVVLGNRWKPDGDNNVYASVVSHVGNRATLVHAAREGFHAVPFDIGNAFIRASMGDVKVVVTIPETFREDGSDDSGRRMLLKALYGLPISPRLWAKCLGKDLKSLGWTECITEPGVWRKKDADGKIIGY